MSKYDEKPVSLLERKKKQWALEKDELENSWAPWTINRDHRNSTQSERYHLRILQNEKSPRKNSLPLPPLKIEKCSGDGETSGYTSDNPTEFPNLWENNSENINNTNSKNGYESSSSFHDERSKWIEKVPESDLYEPPNWLKRGLEQNGHYIEVTNSSSPSESPEADRPLTSSSSFVSHSYILGQNRHLDSNEIADRIQKREKARKHQEEIRKQLEERLLKKSEERERKIREEYEEELRIAKDRERERLRMENEQKLLREKQELDEKRQFALQKAIELAETEAKIQKEKLKISKYNNEKLNNEKTDFEKVEFKNIDRKDEQQQENEKLKEVSIKNNLEPEQNSSKKNDSLICDDGVRKDSSSLSLIVPSNFEPFQHFQYAVLMPIQSNAIPLAVPLNVENANSTTRTENRILTPTQYRQNKNKCDISTQTDEFYKEKESNSDKNKNRKIQNNEKPKWGVNRPPTRYLKQSEKDLGYQKRKQRIDVGNCGNSSDDEESQICAITPRYRKKEKRTTWRKKNYETNPIHQKNLKMYQSEIIEIETDKNNVFYEHKCCCSCRCTGRKIMNDLLKFEKLPKNIKKNRNENDILPTLHRNTRESSKNEYQNSPRITPNSF